MAKQKLKVGEYECLTVKKGYNEPFIDGMKEGDIYWMVKTDRDGGFDTKSQGEAIIISKLIKIEKLLEKAVKK